MYNNTGDILHVDLNKKTWWKEFVKKDDLLLYLGGRGISAKILWDLVKPGTDPLGPENILIFGAGLLSGSAAPSSGRTTVTCLSPATGLYMKTSAGGYWGGELKYAGYGHIVIHGRSDKPVYLWIDDANVEIRDASSLWGMDVRTADAAIKAELEDDDIQVSVIGQAGENLVRFASVMFSVYNAAGRCGAGAVMGSKNLKAIAVRGSGAVTAAKPERFHEVVMQTRENLLRESGIEGLRLYGTAGSLNAVNELRIFPAYNFQRSCVDDVYPLSGQCLIDEGYLKRRVSCFSCVIGCHRFTTIDRGVYAGTYSGGPEYESLGALGAGCGIMETEPVIKANELCNIYGMDTISAGSVIQWAMECFEKGVIGPEDLDGEELHWGNAVAVHKMIKQIAFREGFGDVLADGVKRAAERIGKNSYQWAVEAKGLEQSRVDTRSAKGYALAFAVNPRGADHLHTETFAEFGLSPESRALIKKITGDEKYASPRLTEKRAEIVRWHEDCFAVTDCLGFCAFSTTALYGVTPQAMAELFSAFTGFDINEAEIMEAGRRIVTMERCYNVRLGETRKEDTLPWRLMNESTPDLSGGNTVNSQEELDQMLDQYYDLHDWDRATACPRWEVLIRLRLRDVAKELADLGLLVKPF
ncbi:MAG TPA: aldehyde ferredoxin oxidoreductase family protein [Candidatus Limnocylindrales bacterium]|nr:aldehyde ferredoxin oxidoreductase family protein [Candidatus Limnocylindrales bacterium]